MVVKPIEIVGLREFNRALKGLDSNLPKAVRLALNEATDLVIDYAVPDIPTRTGRAARSVRAKSTRTEARVSAGGTRVPYYPWLDFGGAGPNNRPAPRPFRKSGRYLFVAYNEHRSEFTSILERALHKVATDAGLDVS